MGTEAIVKGWELNDFVAHKLLWKNTEVKKRNIFLSKINLKSDPA